MSMETVAGWLRRISLVAPSIALLLAAAVSTAQAAVTMTMRETTNGVVFEADGSVDTTSLDIRGGAGGSPFVNVGTATFLIGSQSNLTAGGDTYLARVIRAPTRFGPGNGLFSASSSTGPLFGLGPDQTGVQRIQLPSNYTSGTVFASSATFDFPNFDTFAEMGIAPGRYVWQWEPLFGAPGSIQSATLNVVPVPAALPLFGTGLLALVAYRRLRR